MESEERYEAGLCNIGQQEIGMRKKLFTVSLLVTLILTCFSLCCYPRTWMTLLIFGSTFFTLLLFIEIRLKFCILFGFFNLQNFKKLGHLENVTDHDHRQKDKNKAFKIISLTCLAAGVLTYVDYLVVVYIYL